RVRQIETKALDDMRAAFKSQEEWRSVRWAVERVKHLAGAYAPGDTLDRALPTWPPTERRLVARLAGYELVDPVLVRDGLSLPGPDELPVLGDTDFVVDEYELVERLRSFGVQPQFIDFTLGAM